MKLYEIEEGLEFLAQTAEFVGKHYSEAECAAVTINGAEWTAEKFADKNGIIDAALISATASLLFDSREAKIDAMAHYALDLAADEEKLDAEIKRLQKRKKSAGRRREWLKACLCEVLDGQKYKSSACPISISFRSSKTTEIDDLDKIPSEFLVTVTEVHPDKMAIKKAIDAGQTVEGAHIAEHKSVIIK